MQTPFDKLYFAEDFPQQEQSLLRTGDGKIEFVRQAGEVLALVKTPDDFTIRYNVKPTAFAGPAKAVLMDLDGTTVLSEHLWIQALEETVGLLTNTPDFTFSLADLPFVSGYSTREHLLYCVKKYNIETEMSRIIKVHSQVSEALLSRLEQEDLLRPAPGLREFLLTLKQEGIKIALVTSASEKKAVTEIVSVFRQLDLGNPLDFYDTIITAGKSCAKHKIGTLGSLSAKPHPWLYVEAARTGLGLAAEDATQIIGIEDSAAGIVALKLAGFAAAGMKTGNIAASGAGPLLIEECESLVDLLPLVLGET